MPTIDELPPVASVSDTDELPISQAGNLLKATRGQILAGVQPALYVPSGSLLGRTNPGSGSPGAISVGANLSLNLGTLTAKPPFSISALGAAGPFGVDDLVPVGQGGQDAAVTYGAFMGGLPRVPGIDGSQLQVNIRGTPGERPLSVVLADAVTVESFGAHGDGITDDSVAFALAVASGRPVRLDARIYIVNAGFSAPDTFIMLGVVNATIIRRLQQLSDGPWIVLSGQSVTIQGAIFDSGSLVSSDCPSLQIMSSCQSSLISSCGFMNATGGTKGHGLCILSTPLSRHEISECSGLKNALSGVYADGGGYICVRNSQFADNGQAGISLSDGWRGRIDGNECTSNQFGISAGSWASAGPGIGLACSAHVSGNVLFQNSAWGIAIGGNACQICDNVITCTSFPGASGGILGRLTNTRIASNIITGGGTGIDCRSSVAVHRCLWGR